MAINRPNFRTSGAVSDSQTHGGFVEADSGASDFASDALEAIGAALNRALLSELVPIVEEAFDAWPVDSGDSKDSIGLDYHVGSGSLIATISVSAPYATDIVFRGTNTSVANALIVQQVNVALDGIADAFEVNLTLEVD